MVRRPTSPEGSAGRRRSYHRKGRSAGSPAACGEHSPVETGRRRHVRRQAECRRRIGPSPRAVLFEWMTVFLVPAVPAFDGVGIILAPSRLLGSFDRHA
ncbi:hypothetical protein WR25_05952 [Diploscapter pachys]|uniref:Uncharacterized protein n=1 Tax=Diploscapter pachys TaxID=2018661 RepID=A0A2A2KAR0_9BILA|nr:hypothetical protein WR25_05952 [Diploscapter pachys]